MKPQQIPLLAVAADGHSRIEAVLAEPLVLPAGARVRLVLLRRESAVPAVLVFDDPETLPTAGQPNETPSPVTEEHGN